MRLLTNLRTLLMMAVAVAGFASRMDAGTFLFPSLNPGDKFRLVFVTSTTTDATSPDIDYYNSFVTDVANTVPALSALGATWTAIGSTSAVSAATNIGATDSGIYRLDGLEVAAGTAALFATGGPSGVPLMNPISTTPWDYFNFVWTGSNPDGSSYSSGGVNFGLGNTSHSPAYCIFGRSAATDPSWSVEGGYTLDYSLSLYAISSELTVGGDAAPEPATISLMALGGAFLLLALRRKQQNHMVTRTDRTLPAYH